MLVISQANEEWKVKEERWKPYNGYLKPTGTAIKDKPTGTMIKPLVIIKIKAPCYGGESVISTQIRPEEKTWFYDI